MHDAYSGIQIDPADSAEVPPTKSDLLDQQRPGAADGGKQRGRHAGRAGADHDDVVARRDLG